MQFETHVNWSGDLLPPCLIPEINWRGDGAPLPIIWGQNTTIGIVYQSVSAMTGPNTSPYQWFALNDGESASMEFCCNGFKLILNATYTHNYLGRGTPQELLVGADLNIEVIYTNTPCEE